MAPTVSAVQSPWALIASSLGVTVLLQLSVLLLSAQGSIVIVTTAGIAGLSLCRALVDWVGVAKLVAVGEGD